MLNITTTVRIPMQELSFSFARSSGPGGQNVNKVSSKVLLSFDIGASAVLSDSDKRRIFRKLSGRISRRGILHVVAMRHRSQHANRQESIDRFVKLLQQALAKEKKRIPTGIPAGARRKRLQLKKRRAVVKQGRRLHSNEFD